MVTRRTPFARAILMALLLSAPGCIDDFSHPGQGYVDDSNGTGDGNGNGNRRGPSCTSVCERAAECPDSGIEEPCPSYCAEIERLIQNARCTREWDALIECDDDISNICTPSEDDCGIQGERLVNCISDYCADYPDDCGDTF